MASITNWHLSCTRKLELPRRRNLNGFLRSNKSLMNPVGLIYGLTNPTNFNCSRTIKSVLEAQFLQTWSTKLDSSSKGLNYRLFKDSINLEPYFVKLPRTLFMHLGKLRTGNHRFPCERGRWQELELSERKCLLCSRQEIGDEFHYLLVCPFFNSERKRFIERHYYSNPNILKFKALMNCTDERRLKDLCIFAKILIKNVQ